MWIFLVDEDMPRSTAPALRDAGHAAVDVRDVGLRGHSDAEVFAYAQAQGAVLITADKGFADVLAFAPGTHASIIVVRVPNELPTKQVNQQLLRALADLRGKDLKGLLIIHGTRDAEAGGSNPLAPVLHRMRTRQGATSASRSRSRSRARRLAPPGAATGPCSC